MDRSHTLDPALEAITGQCYPQQLIKQIKLRLTVTSRRGKMALGKTALNIEIEFIIKKRIRIIKNVFLRLKS